MIRKRFLSVVMIALSCFATCFAQGDNAFTPETFLKEIDWTMTRSDIQSLIDADPALECETGTDEYNLSFISCSKIGENNTTDHYAFYLNQKGNDEQIDSVFLDVEFSQRADRNTFYNSLIQTYYFPSLLQIPTSDIPAEIKSFERYYVVETSDAYYVLYSSQETATAYGAVSLHAYSKEYYTMD